MNARDWDALGDCYAEDHEIVDRRMLGWETLRGPAAAVGMFRSWIDIAPDGEVRFETLAGDGEHIAPSASAPTAMPPMAAAR